MTLTTKPILCYVTDRRSLPAAEAGAGVSAPAASLEPLRAAIVRAAAAGVDWIQIREKDLDAANLAAVTSDAVRAAGAGSRMIVNDRLDVALAAGAGGVHLGEASLPVESVVRWARENAPAGFLVGVSRHSLEKALQAEGEGADYVVFGPVFETSSKRAYGPPQGLKRLAKVCQRVRIPVLAIGGVTLENAQACLAEGAAGVAAIHLFQNAADMTAVIGALRALH
ncbi:MAG: thiamine phosphate synthase [Candidatus Acidiferrales bacterium]